MQALLLAIALTGQTVDAQGIYAGYPHNVHDTRVFNGSWTSGANVGGRAAVATPIGGGKYRVSFLQLLGSSWQSSFSVETDATGRYEYRTYSYAPFTGAILGELYPPVTIQVR